jgi:hypothetical protein
VVASRNSERSDTPSRRSASSCCGTIGSDTPLRTSIAMATRAACCSCCSAMNEQQFGRQVVDAVVAGVFQRVQRHGLAGARHAGDEDQVEVHGAPLH